MTESYQFCGVVLGTIEFFPRAIIDSDLYGISIRRLQITDEVKKKFKDYLDNRNTVYCEISYATGIVTFKDIASKQKLVEFHITWMIR